MTASPSPSAAGGPSIARALIPVPAGSVEVDGKRVQVAAFSIDRTEVTTDAYARCVAGGKCTAPATGDDCNWTQKSSRGNHPVNCVSFEQAQRYCQSTGQRLPTRAEWQLAAGGPEGRRYPWGNDHPSNLWVTEPEGDSYPPGPARQKLCWVGDGTAKGEKYSTSTCPVASFAAGNTPSGIADLAGNVAEWTLESESLPGGAATQRTSGGGYDFDPMGPLRVGAADSELQPPAHHAPDVGFRCMTPTG